MPLRISGHSFNGRTEFQTKCLPTRGGSILPVPVHHHVKTAVALLGSGQCEYAKGEQVFEEGWHASPATTAALGATTKRMQRNRVDLWGRVQWAPMTQ